MANVILDDTHLTNIADAIRAKNGEATTYTPGDMAKAITDLPSGGGGIPEEYLVISGDCENRFYKGGWDWFINEYGNQITTENISNVKYMWMKSQLEYIPFELNISTQSLQHLFYYAENLKEIPKINMSVPVSKTDSMFERMTVLETLPDDLDSWFNWFNYEDNMGPTSNFEHHRMFYECKKLKYIPFDFLNHWSPYCGATASLYYNGFYYCEHLDNLVLPVQRPNSQSAWSRNAFYSTFYNNAMMSSLRFEVGDSGVYDARWAKQTLDLSQGCGWFMYSGVYNDASLRVVDDATYQALKDNPDYWTTDVNYSRYNHDSAVETINTLPDCSEYIEALSGTGDGNTIKFKGAAGALTDGGAINTLTEEEIAVATAKGWTVSLV